jgi:lipoprotein signal peptidase/predicted Ser/Thr protein kinase
MQIVAQWRRWSIVKKWELTTKSALTANVKWAIKKEILLLQKLNTAGIDWVPQITSVLDNWFEYVWIVGDHFKTIYSNSTKPRQLLLAKRLLYCAYQLDQLWVIHGELHRPTKNVLVWDNDRVFILDFERGALNDYSGKNMKAVGQWLSRVWYIGIESLKNLSWKSLDSIYQELLDTIVPPSATSKDSALSKLLVYGVIWVSIDLITKYVFYELEVWSWSPRLQPLLNYGSARSLPIPHWITRVGALAIGIWCVFEYSKKNIWVRSSALIIAWAVWNSIDRILYGWVRDFIDITSLLQYPIFNIADMFLVVWVWLIVIKQLFSKS